MSHPLEVAEHPPVLEPPSYRRLLRVPGFPGLVLSALLSRTASQMWMVALVLFILRRYHSPSLAGLGVFLLVFPGLALSPLNGALLDRYGRKRLMLIDFAVAYTSLFLTVFLAHSGHLPPALLLVMLTIGSFTSTLSVAGARSLFPLTVPSELWDRANAIDSFAYAPAFTLGPALAGAVTAWLGGEAALLVVAVCFILASLALLSLREPVVEAVATGSVLRSAWEGLVYVASHATLRGLALSLSIGNVAGGILVIALPLLVFRNLHGGPALVGQLFALQGIASVPATLVFGRFDTRGRERRVMAVCTWVLAAASCLLFVPATGAVALAILIGGAVAGPYDVALFSIRQRRTHPAWFGRAFAVSMSVNFAGAPLGSALAGPIAGRSVSLAIWLMIAVSVLSAVLMMTIVPANEEALPEP